MMFPAGFQPQRLNLYSYTINNPGREVPVIQPDYIMAAHHDLKVNYAFLGRNDSNGGADTTKQKFTQKERDSESGLDYFLARYYSSAQGRFTSVDPIKLTPGRMHELFGETYKYTPAGIKEGLNSPARIIDDSNKVIEIENIYRDFHGLPRRSGTDHGYFRAEMTVRPK